MGTSPSATFGETKAIMAGYCFGLNDVTSGFFWLSEKHCPTIAGNSLKCWLGAGPEVLKQGVHHVLMYFMQRHREKVCK